MVEAKRHLSPPSPPQKRRRTTMAELSNDLILDIIARLPLRYAIQCMLLNKTFLHSISDPSFLRRKALLSSLLSSSSRSSNTSIFYYSRNFFTIITPEISATPVSTTLPLGPSILASCNGVLLLRFHFSSYYVFNPNTGGIMSVDHPLTTLNGVGLAVDLDAQKNSHFKLVTVDIPKQTSIVRFSVVVPSSSGVDPSMVVKSQVEFISSQSFTLMPEIYTCLRPVYIHGCLHWLGNGGKKIIVFDVEKEMARIINGPVDNNEPEFHSGVGKWFGSTDGSLQFVYTLEEEIVIQSHNYLKDEWEVKHRIGKICDPSYKDLWDVGILLFFDGQRLFVKLHGREEYAVVLVHDILSDKWEKMGKVFDGRPDCFQPFFSFFPTLAKVSDTYLQNFKTEFPSMEHLGLFDCTDIDNSLEGLQRLMT